MKKKELLTMKELPESERPYEKAEKEGIGRLSHAELLAIILTSGRWGRPPSRSLKSCW